MLIKGTPRNYTRSVTGQRYLGNHHASPFRALDIKFTKYICHTQAIKKIDKTKKLFLDSISTHCATSFTKFRILLFNFSANSERPWCQSGMFGRRHFWACCPMSPPRRIRSKLVKFASNVSQHHVTVPKCARLLSFDKYA